MFTVLFIVLFTDARCMLMLIAWCHCHTHLLASVRGDEGALYLEVGSTYFRKYVSLQIG